ncbi:putative SUR7/PalI family protein [Lyophyllum shimeji]|uniref:SUR7/PalI family protein n=1 Tax=Lyophyllum shimeji TaxID=47721 RepID=A0A9P3PX25_LYOSH|nr:putative SUR7/PalI family protein [Lyophyllum shimeji]
MARAFCIPGVLFLAAALVLSFLTSISLPYLPAIDIARTHFGTQVIQSEQQAFTDIRFGVWAPCYYDEKEDRTCFKAAHGYKISISNQEKTANVIIGSSWTQGLAVHPVAAGVTFIAFLMSFSQHVTVTLAASLTSFLAAFITLIAFAIDIALFAYLKHQVNKLPDVNGNTTAGAGFWMTLASFILLLLAGCTVCFGRRRERMSGATSYPALSSEKKSFWSRFRRN